ncbi:MAG: 1-acyl-sn-glycerol-3-phosphate acyltransferase [Bacteroidales bacterium]|nr:1-acyl-sn-glycerol-3-phosphate acyltransferase [Bacteroidales bacterium]
MIQINIEEIIKTKSAKLHRLLPRFVIRYLRHILHEDEINDILIRYHGQDGVSFANGVMEEFQIRFNVHHQENIPTEGRFIVASNHPLGGFDGLALITLISNYHRNIKFPVNDFLMHLPNMQDIFVPVNKTGRNSVAMAYHFDEIFRSDNVILYFPAGICSRKIAGKIQDMEWKKTFVSKAKAFHRDILPVYFSGRNSEFFYRLANLRRKLRLKTNLEMAFLADELFKQRHSLYDVYIGKPISYKSLTGEKSDYQWAQEIRNHVYQLRMEN